MTVFSAAMLQDVGHVGLAPGADADLQGQVVDLTFRRFVPALFRAICAEPVDAPAAEPAGLTFQEYSFTAGTAGKRGVFVKNLPVRNDGRVIHYQPPVSASRANMPQAS